MAKAPAVEEYELLPRESRASASSEASEGSATSEVFESLHNSSEPETFESSPVFQASWRQFEGSFSLSNKNVSLVGIGVLVVWVIALMAYALVSPRDLARSFHRATDLVRLNGQNLTLNRYDSHHVNVSLEGYKRDRYFPDLESVQWLSVPQYPKDQGGGFYLTRERNGAFSVRQIHSDYRETVLLSLQFSYHDNFFYANNLVLNPAVPVDDRRNAVHLVVLDSIDQWRHLSFALYWLWNPHKNTFVPIQPPLDQKREDEKLDRISFARFAPDGKSVVFGFDRDLYTLDLDKDTHTRLTSSGSPNVFNGKPDWVYEEEISASDALVWFSPDSSHLIYASIDDSEVPSYGLDYYVKSSADVGMSYDQPAQEKVNGVNQYPVQTSVKYPKPGTNNPIISLHIVHLKEGATKLVGGPENLGADFLVYDAVWIDNDKFLVKYTDRTSRRMSKYVFSPSTGENTLISTASAADFGGWFDKTVPITVLPDGKYVDRVVVDGRTHLAVFESNSADYKAISKSDKWDVLAEPAAYNANENMVYALTTARSSMDAHLMGFSVDKEEQVNITNLNEDAKYSINFSDDAQYLCLEYQGPDQPWQKLVNTADLHLSDDKNDVISKTPFLNRYEQLAEILAGTNLPSKAYQKVKVGKYDDGTPIELDVLQIFPPGFNPNLTRKYPLLVNVYGGPGSKLVDKSYAVDFQHVVSASLEAIVLVIDPRGTGEGNWKFRSLAKDKIGFWEPRDIITVTSEYIKTNNDVVDEKKTAIWGWSYGGFTTVKTMELDAGNVFKYGMAVAPVTNFLFYDSVYTERYMSVPSDNENYEESARVKDFAAFKLLKKFLIMHGTGDDNVHVQNLLWLIDNFDLNEVENYDVHFFPDSNHGIYYHNAHSVIYDKLWRWLRDAYMGLFDV